MHIGVMIALLWALSFIQPSIKVSNPASVDLVTGSAEILSRIQSKNTDLPSAKALQAALEGYEKLKSNLKNNLLTVIDFSLPSTAKRLWIIDMVTGEVKLSSVVAHGRNSGELMAEKFSNRPESYQSSLGFYTTAETYQGKHGYSLRLDGLEKGFNDLARARAIVIHGADYATETFAKSTGRLGRSLGCPALPTELSAKVIDLIKNGSLLFIFGNQPEYLSQSSLVQP